MTLHNLPVKSREQHGHGGLGFHQCKVLVRKISTREGRHYSRIKLTFPMHLRGPARNGIKASGSRLAVFSTLNRSGLYLNQIVSTTSDYINEICLTLKVRPSTWG